MMRAFVPGRLPLLVLAFLGVDTATQMAFKLAADAIGDVPLGTQFALAMAATPAAWLAVALYVATYALWMLLLKDTDLSRAFPLTALSYVTVPALGWLAFGEAVGMWTIAGIALILVGVALVGGGEEGSTQATPSEVRSCES